MAARTLGYSFACKVSQGVSVCSVLGHCLLDQCSYIRSDLMQGIAN